jgi:hypothetical protein
MTKIIKSFEIIITKVVAREIVKLVGKRRASSVVPKIPGVGLIVGSAIGIYRFGKGDPGRALMEIGSGAASCIPIYGTGVSVVMDCCIVGIDLHEATKEWKTKKTKACYSIPYLFFGILCLGSLLFDCYDSML